MVIKTSVRCTGRFPFCDRQRNRDAYEEHEQGPDQVLEVNPLPTYMLELRVEKLNRPPKGLGQPRDYPASTDDKEHIKTAQGVHRHQSLRLFGVSNCFFHNLII